MVFARRRLPDQAFYSGSDHTARSRLFPSTRARTKNALNAVTGVVPIYYSACMRANGRQGGKSATDRLNPT